MSQLSDLPSVEQVLQTQAAIGLSKTFGRPLTLEAIREALDELRTKIRSNAQGEAPLQDRIVEQARSRLMAWTRPGLRPVINATGVILHTNLGRAPLSAAAAEAMQQVAVGYSDLELDLASGKRGSRFSRIESQLQKLTGAPAAIVVNNNAAAVLLALSTLATRRRVIVARSQLVEIGGGFRMPDVMRQSGARLLEVGTTNRVRLSDYEENFAEAAVVLRVHRSNFQIVGFTEEPDFAELALSAHRAGLLVIDDLGSGALLDTARYGLAHEPTVQESLAAGADLTCFSADKLVGGPQAGIIIGDPDLIARLRKHPLARAVRADKTCLAGIEATLDHYLRGQAEAQIPVWRMISVAPEDVKARAQAWAEELGTGEVCPGESTLGGGSLPGESLPTYLLALSVSHTEAFLKRLRNQDPPIVARADKGKVLLDPRTVDPGADSALLKALHLVMLEQS